MGGLTLVVIVVASAAISAGGIRALLPWLQRHAMAHPNARSSHRIPTPQGGGIAVVGAAVTVAAAGVVAALVPLPADIGTLWWALGAAVFIALVGAADDARSVGVAPRLMFQAAAVCLVVASLPVELRVVPILPWWVERAILLVGCLWFVNLTNFMDGIDWMTVAEFVPLAAGLVVIGMTGALPDYAIFVALALDSGEDAAQDDLGAFRQALQVGSNVRGKVRSLVLILIERMAGDVETEHLLFAGQFFVRGPVGNRRQRVGGGRFMYGQVGKQTGLAASAIFPRSRSDFHGSIDDREELRARAAQRVERSGLDETFDHATVHSG